MTPTPTAPAISPADLASLWEKLLSTVKYAEAEADDDYDREVRYIAKVRCFCAYWNLTLVHDALIGKRAGGFCRGACPHLADGLSEEQLAALLARIEADHRAHDPKNADPDRKWELSVHQSAVERLRDELLKRRAPGAIPG